jgi:hypothetical protein
MHQRIVNKHHIITENNVYGVMKYHERNGSKPAASSNNVNNNKTTQ